MIRRFVFMKKMVPRGLSAPASRLYTCILHYIQTSLKPLGQLKPNFMWSFVGKRE